MKQISVGAILTVFIFMFLLGCSTVYRLESGEYVLAIKQPASSKSMPKNVSIVVDGKNIEVRNLDDDRVLKGNIEGNKILITGQTESQAVEFKGNLVADNQVTGNVIQKSDTSVQREAVFTIVTRKPEKKKQ